MKTRQHRVNRLYPAITREQRVERAAKREVSPAGRGAEADALTDRMDAGIGSSGRVRHGPMLKEALENALELELDRPSGGLALPPDKAGAVVL